MELKFNTVIEDSETEGLKKAFGVTSADIDTCRTSARIDWEIQPDIRQYGIKSLEIVIKKVVCSVEWTVSDCNEYMEESEQVKLIASGGVPSNGGDVIDGLIEVNSDVEWNGKKWTFEVGFEFESYGGCIPSFCTVNFETMIIKVW